MSPSEYFDKILAEKRETIERLTREVETLRKLPVIATCGDCRWCHPTEVCAHERAHIEHEIDGSDRTPPEWCPLRGGAR